MRSNMDILQIALNPNEFDVIIDLVIAQSEASNAYEAAYLVEDTEWMKGMIGYDYYGTLFEDAYIAITNWDERAYSESDYSLRLPDRYTEKDVVDRWEEFGDMYIDTYGSILKQFYGFPPGTPRESVWYAFEETGLNVYDALNYGRFTFRRRP
jgi:hypothetical protein